MKERDRESLNGLLSMPYNLKFKYYFFRLWTSEREPLRQTERRIIDSFTAASQIMTRMLHGGR